MSTTYKAVQGDTFELISRKLYGHEGRAGALRSANPGISDPPTPGSVLTAPPAAAKKRQQPATGEAVSVRINGNTFKAWTEAEIVRALDAPDTLEIIAPFDPSDLAVRAAFKPFAFPSVSVLVDGKPLFTGTQVAVSPSVSANSATVAASSYSLPGVLQDCTLPASAFPLEFQDLDLGQIARQVCSPFGLSVRFEALPGRPFTKVACRPDQRAMSFLTDLAQQRGLVIGSTPDGALVFRQSAKGGIPAATLEEGHQPLISVTPTFSPQQYYSHITGVEPVAVGAAGSQYTVRNARLLGALRPLTFNVQDAEGGSVEGAVRAKMGRMFANMASYDVAVATWRDSGGDLWKPGDIVRLKAPSAMVYSYYNFEVRSVRLRRTEDSETAVLNLIFPGSYAGETPGRLPWDV